MQTVVNHTCIIIFFSILMLIQRLKLSDKEEQNLPDAPEGERMATMFERQTTYQNSEK